MNKIISLLFIFAPLVACAAENSNSKAAVTLEHIRVITSDKSSSTDRQHFRSLLKWSDECESGYEAGESSAGIDIYPENGQKYLIQVTCTLGAYQGYQQFYNLSLEGGKTTVKTLIFPIYEVVGNKKLKKELSADVWGVLNSPPTYKNLTIYRRYSGYGNCGTLTTYKITDGAVRAIKFRSEPDCESETASRDADKWPVYPIP